MSCHNPRNPTKRRRHAEEQTIKIPKVAESGLGTDGHTRERLAVEVDASLGGHRACHILDRIGAGRSHPKRIPTDNGPELGSKASDRWACMRCVEQPFLQLGKPVQSAFIGSFNGTMRNGRRNGHWFLGLEDAMELIEAWRVDCDAQRPHSSLGGMAPLRPSSKTSLKPPRTQTQRPPARLSQQVFQ